MNYENVEVAVNGINFDTSIGESHESETGSEDAIVDITTTNNTDEELDLSMLRQMTMKNGRDERYKMAIDALSSLNQKYEESPPIAAGESRRGKIPYGVEDGVSPLYWIFEFNFWVEGDRTFWKVR